MDSKCVRRWWLPCLVVVALVVGITIYELVYHGDQVALGRKRTAQAAGRNARVAALLAARKTQAAATDQPPVATPASLVPPWRSKNDPLDAVTGATPKRVSFNQAIQIVSPSVVGINTSGGQPQSASGIIVHQRGYILTNHHVVDGAKEIVVTLVLDQMVKSYPAKLIDSNPKLDLAVIQVSSPGQNVFQPAPLGDSNKLEIGEDVVAIGNPFGLAQSASAGIISNTERAISAGDRTLDGLIQTDASINPGSSGGALVNTRAEVIGVSTAIYSPVQGFTGVGFAVPINHARTAFPDFIQEIRSPIAQSPAAGGNVNRPNAVKAGANVRMMAARRLIERCWLGIDVYPMDSIVAREINCPIGRGVLINRVFGNSPGTKAGLLRGDVVYRVNQRRVRDVKMFWSYLASAKAGDQVELTFLRGSRKQTVVVTLEPEPTNARSLLSKAPQGAAAGAVGTAGIEEISWLGIDIQPLTDTEALQEFGIPPTESGVLIGEVEGVAAIDAGLQPGDLIRKVNRYEVKDMQSFKEVIKKVDPSEGILLDIVRQKRPFYVTIRPTQQDRGAW